MDLNGQALLPIAKPLSAIDALGDLDNTCNLNRLNSSTIGQVEITGIIEPRNVSVTNTVCYTNKLSCLLAACPVSEDKTTSLSNELLDHLAEMLIHPTFTLRIIKQYRPCLIELCARIIYKYTREVPVNLNIAQSMATHNVDWWPEMWFPNLAVSEAAILENESVPLSYIELVLGMLSMLLPTLPQIQSFATFFMESNHIYIDKLLVSLKSSHNIHRQRFIMRSIYRLIILAPQVFVKYFKWSTFNSFLLQETDIYTLAYCAHIISFLTLMSDADRKAFIEKYVPLSLINLDVEVLEGSSFDDKEHLTLLPYIESQVNGLQQIDMFKFNSSSSIVIMEHCSYITNVCGILLPNANAFSGEPCSSPTTNFVLTETVEENLRNLAQSVSLQMPVLLEGSSSSGKTCLVSYLASKIGKGELLKIHLGDQTDSKILLGTYISTDTPGIFKWQPGILTSAVTQGRWLLIEDIDLAPHEVLSVLIPLLETRTLFIASRGVKIRASEDFRIFATRTTSHRYILSNSTVENLWHKIPVQDIPELEVQEIVHLNYPRLDPFLEPIMRSYSSMKLHSEKQKGFSRKINLRDLFKWCNRVSNLSLTLEVHQIFEDILREAHDVFLGYIADADFGKECFIALGKLLSVPTYRSEFFIDTFVPEVKQLKENTVQIGRAQLTDANIPTNSLFALTNHASRLLEKLSVSVKLNERILLIGETGTGKTTAVQYLARLMNRQLDVYNMSQQSESSDLLGGFKPMDSSTVGRMLVEEFTRLFSKTFNAKKNAPFLQTINKAYLKNKWKHLFTGFRNAIKMAKDIFSSNASPIGSPEECDKKSDTPIKKVKTGHSSATHSLPEWLKFEKKIMTSEMQMEKMDSGLFFTFVEGTLVKAVKNGDWILLDEINLANAETLESLSGLLQDVNNSSLLLYERGDTEPIKPHPEFRLFGCMNPANDTGKHDLPPGLRSRFTEYWIDSPDRDMKDLELIIRQYLFSFLPAAHEGTEIVRDVAEFYTKAKQASTSVSNLILDGANRPIHYSTRTLSRALSYSASIVKMYGARRSIYEGLIMTFITQLNEDSRVIMMDFLNQHMLHSEKNISGFLKQIPRAPSTSEREEYALFGSFWIKCGELEMISQDDLSDYVITSSVNLKLNDLARAVMARNYPVLIQGPTSAGKTSMIEYLAKRTGHRFVRERINNHEHTDLQEYIGSYVPDSDGHLIFKEGVLVEALRKGYWIVLDELNLAPSDVLEALNRLLDDNRELLIPETQEIVKPHPNFLLFATQNPPGLYGGRKVLSRAFRNRFLELHFNDLPENELHGILYQRCKIAPSYAKKIVDVYLQLRTARQRSRIFDGKHGFITLRDLFRWANRHADSYQLLAEDGYMILGERTRTSEDSAIVKACLEEVMRVKIDVEAMYNRRFTEIHEKWSLSTETSPFSLVWTKAMKRLYALVGSCILNNEPVLLVGETGCAKTSVCQLLSWQLKKHLHIVNVHQNSETSDFLGSQRPVRSKSLADEDVEQLFIELVPHSKFSSDPVEYTTENVKLVCESLENVTLDERSKVKLQTLSRIVKNAKALFEWADGPLVKAMKNGDFFLLDEISLADDSVLERLNSVLEPQRLLVLAEKLEESGGSVQEIFAKNDFQFLATMNPGGDYGKKELSPALRNRFTEIWVPQIDDQEDIIDIIDSNLTQSLVQWGTSRKIYSYLDWIACQLNTSYSKIFSVRDLLGWANFMNASVQEHSISESFYHAGCMVIVDGVGANPLLSSISIPAKILKANFESKLRAIATLSEFELSPLHLNTIKIVEDATVCGILGFNVKKGDFEAHTEAYNLSAPTTKLNTLRVFRALQITKPILLEGSPGVGKTSLVCKLASLTGNKLIRINLSEQTDLMDLFGSDLPVESESSDSPKFAWRDGPFLQAMTLGYWILLDELNLATQQVLEGLNACLDHRGSVYIPELDKTFLKSPNFRIFAAQNPQEQGGGRKGLPKSFLNRFTKVYIDAMTENDLIMISASLHSHIDVEIIRKMIGFTTKLQESICVDRNFGLDGSPWEFNIRDTSRWISLLDKYVNSTPSDHVELIFSLRMRNDADRIALRDLFQSIFGVYPETKCPSFRVTESFVKIGKATISRNPLTISDIMIQGSYLSYLISNGVYLEALVECIEMNWMTLLYGPPGCGKTSLIRHLAQLTGNHLVEFSMNEGVDTLEILGGFEQIDLNRKIEAVKSTLSNLIIALVRKGLFNCESPSVEDIVKLTDAVQNLCHDNTHACYELLQSMYYQYPSSMLLECMDLVLELVSKTKNFGQGQFEWIDSHLINALEKGYWVMLDHANLCSPSVLDRLNSLFEPNGYIIMNEKGSIDGNMKVIYPHPNFRLFMTLDPARGEISRAMRNRGIEIFMLDSQIEFEGAPDKFFETIVKLDIMKKESVLSGRDCKEVSLDHIKLDLVQRGLIVQDLVFPPMLPGVFPINLAFIQNAYSTLYRPILHLENLQNVEIAQVRTLIYVTTNESVNMNFPLLFSGLRTILKRRGISNYAQLLSVLKRLNQLELRGLDVCLMRRLLFIEEKIMHLVRDDSRLSTLKMSLDFCQGNLFESQLSHPSVKLLYPLYTALHKFNLRFDDHKNTLLIKIEEQLVDLLFGESVDIFGLWMIIEDASKSLDFVRENRILFDEIMLSLNIKNTKKFKLAWKIWSSMVPKNESQFLIQNELRILNDVYTLKTGSSDELILSIIRMNDFKTKDLICDLSRLLSAQKDEPVSDLIKISLEHIVSTLKISKCDNGTLQEASKYDTLISRKGFFAALLPLLLVHLNQDKAFRGIMSWLNDCTIPGDLYQNLLQSMLPLSVVQNFRKNIQPENEFCSAKTWLKAIWEGHIGLSKIISSHSFLDSLLKDLKCTMITELKSDRMSSGPQYMYQSLCLPTALQAQYILEKSTVEQYPFVKEWISRSSEALLHLDTGNSDKCINFSSLLFLKLFKILLLILQVDIDYSIMNSISSFLTNIDVIESVVQSISKTHSLIYLSHSVKELKLSSIYQSKWLYHIGRAFCFLALSLLDTIYKSRLIDPIEEQNARYIEFLDEIKGDSAYYEYLLTIKIMCAEIDYKSLEEFNIKKIRNNDIIKEYEASCGFRPRVSNIRDLSDDVQQFLNGPLNANYIVSIIDDSVDFDMRESLLHNNIVEYFDRMSLKHSHFEDILTPLSQIVNLLRTGMRMTIDGRVSDDMHELTLFNVLRNHDIQIEALMPLMKTKSILEQKSLLCAFLEEELEKKDASGTLKISLRANTVFEKIYDIWSRNEEILKDNETKATAIYRFKAEEESGDRFLPDIYTEIEDILQDDPMKLKETIPDNSGTSVDFEELAFIVRKYQKSLLHNSGRSNPSFSSLWRGIKSDLASFNIATKVLDKQTKLLLLNITSTHLEKQSESNTDFYNDANVEESCKILPILESLDEKITHLLTQWPENFMLLQVRKLIIAISKMPLKSSVMRFLSAAEILLLKCEEWEVYASSKVSLKENMAKLTELLISWRKLELSSWNTLLQCENIKFERSASRLWFHLYRILILGSSKCNEMITVEHLGIVREVLGTYILSSKLGDFKYRLDILSVFVDHLQSNLIHSSLNMAISQPIIDITRNFVDYYSQFSTLCDKKISSHFQESSKKIQEFTKIASWKDVNVFALKNAALKSHRQLNKYLRMYHQALSIPMTEIFKLFSLSEKSVRALHVSKAILPEITSLNGLITSELQFDHLIIDAISKYSNRCKELSQKFRSSSLIKLCSSVEQISVDIIDYLHQFLLENKEIEAGKAPRGYKTRRRKALSDLFKTLRALGILRPTCKKSVNDYLNLPTLLINDIASDAYTQLFKKSEHYHYKSLYAFSEIEGVMDPPHVDLTRRDNDLMNSTRHHILELSTKQRMNIQHISKHHSFLVSFTDGIQTKEDEIYPVSQLKWNFLLCEITSMKNDLEFLFRRSDTVFRKFPLEFSAIQTALSAHLVSLGKKLSLLHQKHNTISFILISQHQKDMLKDLVEEAIHVRDSIEMLLAQNSSFNYILESFISASNTRINTIKISYINIYINDVQNTSCMDSVNSAGNIVTQMLLVIQHLNTFLIQEEDDPPKLSDTILMIDLKCLEKLKVAILNFQPSVPNSQKEVEELVSLFKTLRQFSLSYQVIVDQVWYQSIAVTKASYKLSYILLNLYRFLLKHGFNIPQGHEDNEEESDGSADGMGLTDGSAKEMAKDDIDDIDFEDGLTQDTTEQQEELGEDKNEGMDVEHDFDSKIENVNSKEKQDDESNDEQDDESEDDNTMEDEMGDLDEQDDVLDEKLWDEKEEKNLGEEKLEDDNGVDSNGQETETVAAEQSRDNEPKDETKKESDSKEMDEIEATEFKEKEENQFEEVEKEENHRTEVKDDDMNLDELEDVKDDEIVDSSDNDEEEEPNLESQHEEIEASEAKDDVEVEQVNKTSDIDPNSTEEEQQEDETVNDDGKRASDELEEVKEEDITELQDDTQEENKVPDNIEEDLSKEAKGGSGSVDVNDADALTQSEDKNVDENQASDDNEQMGASEDIGDGNGTGKAPKGDENKKEKDSESASDAPIVPAKTLADMEKKMKMWLKALDESIEGPEEMTSNGESIVNADQEDDTEDAIMDTNNSNDNKDEIPKSDQRKQVDEEKVIPEPERDMDVDVMMPNPQESEEIVEADSVLPEISINVEKRIKEDYTETQEQSENVQSVPKTIPETDELDIVMGEAYEDYQGPAISDIEAREMWRNFSQLTEGLSFALCEQLRLILEPTLNTKYKGDYRTGKRLNMRKIIPYIASHFKKDKIWLRRTKPSKRTYQIMMSIDDSKSMKDSGCTDIAFQSLILITKALQQLEAGELSVVGFGENCRVIHEFGTPLSDEAGVSIIKNFSFDQDKTMVKEMLQQTFHVLENARQSSRNKDLWQLQLILSDGICDDHKSVQSLVSHAAEMCIMTVFIVLDTRKERDSISKMATVSYDTNPESGESVLKMNKYMDTFPFEYYIILRDITGLPQVLAETLRQYFSFVNSN